MQKHNNDLAVYIIICAPDSTVLTSCPPLHALQVHVGCQEERQRGGAREGREGKEGREGGEGGKGGRGRREGMEGRGEDGGKGRGQRGGKGYMSD